MFDLGTSFLASVARDPNALAIVDGAVRLTYREWCARISSVVAGFDALGLKPGDHLVTVLQNRWETATIHWACQFAGIIVTPVNWRATADDLDFFCQDADAKALIYEDVSADAARAFGLIERENITNLYLVPTLYHDLLHHPRFAQTDVSSVRKLGFAGASMTDGLLKSLTAAFQPDLFVNHYGSSEIYTFTIDQNAPAKPGSAGRAGINQMIRVVKLGDAGPDEIAAVGEEGEIIAHLSSDEAFEGYWQRPDANAKALRQNWYFTGDTGYFDADGDLFVTGRLDDIIITGGENVSPVEIESCLSLHPAISEVAVVGLADERRGKMVAAFVKRRAAVVPGALDAVCRASGLGNFKRPPRRGSGG